jgi:AcrR family transcriptional regulator
MGRPVEKRGQIERAVVEVVAQKGLNATTIQDLAEAAGVSVGLLYRYWKNRDELAAQVYRTHYERLIERLHGRVIAAQATPETQGFWPVIGAVLNEFLAFADAEPEVLRFLLLSQHELVRGVPDDFSVTQMLLRLIDFGQAEGVVRPVPRELALQLMLGVGMQPVIGAFYGDLPGPVTRYDDEIFAALRRVLAVERTGGDRRWSGKAED